MAASVEATVIVVAMEASAVVLEATEAMAATVVVMVTVVAMATVVAMIAVSPTILLVLTLLPTADGSVMWAAKERAEKAGGRQTHL